ncbi:AfsR/SARP family transcriptional regulator [Actinokineospora inagensis]|uniref:AfsR/SARP family transcriptional regulator n=1 Tax=Actinokineospora inagensis TaxID=103730 RepID=UPI0004175469|nr:AfsR/SARP family transcriptional regulator [Actinokineospora inagensis]
MRYEIMTSLRVNDPDGYSYIGARKIEVVLVALVIRAGRITTAEQLITEIWGDAPPQRATAALHVYISQLRKFLNRPGKATSTIVTRSPGYLLELGDDEVDVHEFQRLVDRGQELVGTGRHAEAVAVLDRANGMWEDPVLGDLRDGPIVSGFVGWLDEVRLRCLGLLVSANLELGRHAQLIGFLRGLVAEHPLHEEFYRQLMLALHRCGRRAEALNVYFAAREVTLRELGLEPCRALREMQQAILSSADELDAESFAS